MIIDIVLGTKYSRVPLGHHILGNGGVQFTLPLKLGHSVQDKAIDTYIQNNYTVIPFNLTDYVAFSRSVPQLPPTIKLELKPCMDPFY